MNWSGPQALAQIKAEVNKRIEAGCVLIQNDLKQVLSVPAPRKRVLSKSGVIYYRATTPAIPGAPPRKLSGRQRSSITREMDRENLSGKVGTNVKPYPRYHEEHDHPFVSVTLVRVRGDLERVLGTGVGVSVGGG